MQTDYCLKKGVKTPDWLKSEDGRDETKSMDAFYLYNWQLDMIQQLAEKKYGEPEKSRWLREELRKILTGQYHKTVDDALEDVYAGTANQEVQEAVCIIQDAIENGEVNHE